MGYVNSITSFVQNPIESTIEALTSPLGGAGSASIAEWVGRIGTISAIAALSIGASMAQVPLYASIGISIIPTSLVLVLMFGVIWALAHDSRKKGSGIRICSDLKVQNDRAANTQTSLAREHLKVAKQLTQTLRTSTEEVRKETQQVNEEITGIDQQITDFKARADAIEQLGDAMTNEQEDALDALSVEIRELKQKRAEILESQKKE